MTLTRRFVRHSRKQLRVGEEMGKLGKFFESYGGGIHPSAYIGGPPEHRDWRPGDVAFRPDIAPTARIEAYVTVDSGIEESTHVGARAWLMKHVHIGHDAVVGQDCELAPGTVIGGHAVLEDGVKCGIGALVKPFVRVGRGARVGMGAVVLRDVPPGATVVGNPARALEAVAETLGPQTETAEQ